MQESADAFATKGGASKHKPGIGKVLHRGVERRVKFVLLHEVVHAEDFFHILPMTKIASLDVKNVMKNTKHVYITLSFYFPQTIS